MERMKTGWPTPPLMQDDCRALSLWFSTRLGARYLLEVEYAKRRTRPPARVHLGSQQGERVDSAPVVSGNDGTF
jgi:hypothetical protein